MYYYEVAPTQIIRSDKSTFTYGSDERLQIGTLVSIQVGKKVMNGVVVQAVEKPEYTTKPLLSIIEPTPLPSELVKLSFWLAEYYKSPLATVLQTILPRGLQTKRRSIKPKDIIVQRERTNIVFNDEQLSVLAAIESSQLGSFILQGVTGSGKTEIYIEVTKKTLAKNRSVIVLVPEIALTSQLVSQFSQHFEDVLIMHSTMTESERHSTWLAALYSDTPRVVIGARSALFTPLRNIGAIIVDEAHEPSYKQEQSPRYSALRAATMLAKFHDAKAIFGSATPSIQDRYLAERRGEDAILVLTKPARSGTLAPTLTLVDMTKKHDMSNSHRYFSKKLIEQINITLQAGKQVLLFHNRRGSASTTLCDNCGWTAQCPRCHVPLTLHSDQHALRCHICAHNEKVPTSCPICHHVDIIYKGFGTKLIEAALRQLYPKSSIARFDADNLSDQTVNSRYQELYEGDIDIIIGTQVVAKGLDLPHLRTVGVIQADSGLALPDFSASERTFQLLAQVVGRVGRNQHETQVIIQTYQPTHPSIVYGITQDYESFYRLALAERKKALFPPYVYLLKLTCVYKTEAASIRAAKALQLELRRKVDKSVTILGPTPSFYERQHNTYRWQLVLKSPKREYLTNALQFVPPTHWQSELDPTSLL